MLRFVSSVVTARRARGVAASPRTSQDRCWIILLLLDFVLLAPCCGSGTWQLGGLVPSDEIAWVGVLWQGEGGLRGSSLEPWSSERTLELEVDVDASVEVVHVIGFEADSIAKFGAPVDRAPLREAAPFERTLPKPEYSAMARAGGGSLEHEEREWSLHADWLGLCPRDACELFPVSNPRTIELDLGTLDTALVMPFDSRRSAALVAARAEGGLTTFFRVDELGPTILAGSSTTSKFERGLVGEDDRIWLLTQDGRLVGGRPEHLETIARVGQWPSSQSRMDIAGASSEEGVELFVSSGHGTFERFDGSSFTPLDLRPTDGHSDNGVVRIGPGEAIAVFGSTQEAVVFRNGATKVIELPFAPISMALIPGLGTVIGASRSGFDAGAGLYTFDGANVSSLTGSADSSSYGIKVLQPIGDGILFGGVRGFFGFYIPELESCPSRALFAASADSIAVLSFGTLIATTGRDAVPPELILLQTDVERARVPFGCGAHE